MLIVISDYDLPTSCTHPLLYTLRVLSTDRRLFYWHLSEIIEILPFFTWFCSSCVREIFMWTAHCIALQTPYIALHQFFLADRTPSIFLTAKPSTGHEFVPYWTTGGLLWWRWARFSPVGETIWSCRQLSTWYHYQERAPPSFTSFFISVHGLGESAYIGQARFWKGKESLDSRFWAEHLSKNFPVLHHR